MSAEELAMDILHGNITHAWSRLKDWYQGWPSPLKAFVSKWSSDEAKVLQNALIALGTDFFSGKSIPEAAADAESVLASQGIQTTKDDLMDAVRLITSSSVPLSTTVAPIPPLSSADTAQVVGSAVVDG